ncbi:hypothetical protein FA95DRAFT_122759 [Auriscalpium vulgare]|uniref:Uncharacterized protein n=1 Tax=Auriscalpium vulgare TaxID=40419 RepID=A0ACB8RNI7_9AGAM|nr:hypothetical protein FA95DRAFT_122759 [Auriscalpium vulgare]
MARAPLDIQIIVIELVYASCQHEAIDYCTLRACALVCRAWTPIAQRLLFRRVPVSKPMRIHPNNSKFTRLLRTLSAAPHPASHVRSITIILGQEKSTASEDLEVLGLCSNVEGIFIVGNFASSSSLPALAERLRTMRIRPVFLSMSGGPAVVSTLMQIWPSARALEVRAGFDGVTNADLFMAMRIPHAVEALSIFHADLFWAAPIGGLLMVRYLELQELEWLNATLLRHLLVSGVLPRLRSLCITGTYGSPVPRTVLEQLARVETLVVSGLPREAMELPRTLRHLGYHFYGLGHESIAGAQLLMDAARALPELRLVTAISRSSTEVLKRFHTTCQHAGVELVVYKEPWRFPRPGNVDWI